MKKIIVVNGAGGVGKDTICDIVARYYMVMKDSSIAPIKKIAKEYGWDGKKDAKSRKFLSDLKLAFSLFNDLPFKYAVDICKQFIKSDCEILFLHIREPEEINKIKYAVAGMDNVEFHTLLITRKTDAEKWGNISDDGVMDYEYDYIYQNYQPLEDLEEDFMKFFRENIMGYKH